jgi:prevent-host-death family protein
MGDHVNQRARPRPSKRIVGVRELKTHAARIVRQVRDSRASYILTHRGVAVGVILPLEASDSSSQTADAGDASAAWRSFLRAGHRVEGRFRAGVGGVGLLSAARR